MQIRDLYLPFFNGFCMNAFVETSNIYRYTEPGFSAASRKNIIKQSIISIGCFYKNLGTICFQGFFFQLSDHCFPNA